MHSDADNKLRRIGLRATVSIYSQAFESFNLRPGTSSPGYKCERPDFIEFEAEPDSERYACESRKFAMNHSSLTITVSYWLPVLHGSALTR
jgi:hypothetical protein